MCSSDLNLDGANLKGASLHKSNLEGANLQGANLSHACLQGANLQGANLSHAILQDATYNDQTRLPFSLSPEQLKSMKKV